MKTHDSKLSRNSDDDDSQSTGHPSREEEPCVVQPFECYNLSSSSTPLLKPWGALYLDCHGDYRQETWLELHTAGQLYEHQNNLCELPIPSVDATLERFLPTALPLVHDESELDCLQKDVEKFRDQAAELQTRLLARSKDYSSSSSWLQHWWNTVTYLQVRDPVVVNSSYFFHFSDDTTIYTVSNSRADPQIRRAATLLFATAKIRRQIITGALPPEKIGRGDNTKPLCSTSYKYMFHACRIPGSPQDSYRIYDPALHHHAAVAVKGHVFEIPLVDPHTQESVSMETLEDSLQQCVDHAKDAHPATGVTWLTSQNRDEWAKAYQKLQATPTTREALKKIESAACLVCLDDEFAITLQDMAHVLLHGAPSAKGAPLNRWFDKSLQFIVTRNGKAGLLGEHSMMDGMPVARVAEMIASQSYKECFLISSTRSTDVRVAPSAISVFAPDCMPSCLEAGIEQARHDFIEMAANHEIQAKRFSGYGSDWIKECAMMSPDAYIQMVMQIATYRLWDGEQGGTYEATQTRPFLHGRTETTRTVSPESAALVKRFGLHPLWHEVQDKESRDEKLKLLQEATKAHVKYITSASQGYGIDRHFLGLMLSAECEKEIPDLYSNPVFQRAKTWRVSTSQLSFPHFDNWGFGEVTPSGVGLSYAINPKRLNFSITALRRHEWSDRLAHHLVEALLELQMLVEADERETLTTKEPLAVIRQ